MAIKHCWLALAYASWNRITSQKASTHLWEIPNTMNNAYSPRRGLPCVCFLCIAFNDRSDFLCCLVNTFCWYREHPAPAQYQPRITSKELNAMFRGRTVIKHLGKMCFLKSTLTAAVSFDLHIELTVILFLLNFTHQSHTHSQNQWRHRSAAILNVLYVVRACWVHLRVGSADT